MWKVTFQSIFNPTVGIITVLSIMPHVAEKIGLQISRPGAPEARGAAGSGPA